MSELEKTVADILVKATNAAEAAGKFAMEQLPDIAQQYVMYVAIWNSLVTSFVVVSFVVAGFLIRWQLRWIGEWNSANQYAENERYYSLIPTGIVSFIGVLVLGTAFFSAANKAVLAFFAPKVLLIQWAATLVN